MEDWYSDCSHEGFQTWDEPGSEEDYIDDWYCNNCGHGPLTESDDDCPKCGTKNGESFPDEVA